MNEIIDEVKNYILNTRKAYYEYLKLQARTITEQEKQISHIKVLSTALSARRDVAEVFSKNFFEEKKLLRQLADDALEIAIQKGDVQLAQVTIEFIANGYSKSSLAEINKIL